MKIAQILPSLAAFGPIFVAQNLTNALRAKGHTVDVYYFDNKLGLDFGTSSKRIRPNQPIDFDSYDIIHTHGFRPDRYVHKYRHKITIAKTVSTIHQNIYMDFKSLYGVTRAVLYTPYWIYFLRTKDALVPISEHIHSIYHNVLRRITRHIYNGVAINSLTAERQINVCNAIKKISSKSKYTVGLYAVLTPRKRIDQIIKLAKLRSDIAVVIIGDGPQKTKLQELASDISERVLFIPSIPQPYNYLDNIDVFLMLSNSEGFGLALIEAVATKTPAVCSNIPVMRELFTEEEVSFFELDDLNSLSAAIDRAIFNSTTLAQNAYNKYLEKYSVESMGNEYIKLYSELIQQ
ncbi:MAG: glycosyltransferase family 4 protein [Muribaculaceae bacterium]|nr:glycosyltransferase family 4 protein [Muribaculaceae bacterium]